MPFAASFALAVSLALTPASASTVQNQWIGPMPAAQTVEQYVREYFADAPIMAEVARCESRFKQFDNDGSIQGNVAYAKYLYEKEGVQPWASSSPCWSKSKVAKQLALNK